MRSLTTNQGQVPDSGLIKSPIRASQRKWGVKKHKSMIYIKTINMLNKSVISLSYRRIPLTAGNRGTP